MSEEAQQDGPAAGRTTGPGEGEPAGPPGNCASGTGGSPTGEPSGATPVTGPSEGPYLGEGASEEEGVRYPEGYGDTVYGGSADDDAAADDPTTGDLPLQPGAVPERRDPLAPASERA